MVIKKLLKDLLKFKKDIIPHVQAHCKVAQAFAQPKPCKEPERFALFQKFSFLLS